MNKKGCRGEEGETLGLFVTPAAADAQAETKSWMFFSLRRCGELSSSCSATNASISVALGRRLPACGAAAAHSPWAPARRLMALPCVLMGAEGGAEGAGEEEEASPCSALRPEGRMVSSPCEGGV